MLSGLLTIVIIVYSSELKLDIIVVKIPIIGLPGYFLIFFFCGEELVTEGKNKGRKYCMRFGLQIIMGDY